MPKLEFNTDYHIHTVFSGHSAPDMTFGAIVAQAAEKGLDRILVLEHVPMVDERVHCKVLSSSGYRPSDRSQIDIILSERERLRCMDVLPLEVLVGAEVDADPHSRDGSLLLDNLADLDLILASTHYLPGARGMWNDGVFWPQRELDIMIDEWISWAVLIAANPVVNILAHPGASLAAVGAIERFDDALVERFIPLFESCREHNTAFELNELLQSKLDEMQAESYYRLIEKAVEMDVKIALGSDSHRLSEIGRYEWVADIVQRTGISERNIYTPELTPREQAQGGLS